MFEIIIFKTFWKLNYPFSKSSNDVVLLGDMVVNFGYFFSIAFSWHLYDFKTDIGYKSLSRQLEKIFPTAEGISSGCGARLRQIHIFTHQEEGKSSGFYFNSSFEISMWLCWRNTCWLPRQRRLTFTATNHVMWLMKTNRWLSVIQLRRKIFSA